MGPGYGAMAGLEVVEKISTGASTVALGQHI